MNGSLNDRTLAYVFVTNDSKDPLRSILRGLLTEDKANDFINLQVSSEDFGQRSSPQWRRHYALFKLLFALNSQISLSLFICWYFLENR
jgi:hypothetical protein